MEAVRFEVLDVERWALKRSLSLARSEYKFIDRPDEAPASLESQGRLCAPRELSIFGRGLFQIRDALRCGR